MTQARTLADIGVSGAGGVLQVVSHVEDGMTTYSTASTIGDQMLLSAANAADSTTKVQATITPSSTSNKILIQSVLNFEYNSSSQPHNVLWALDRNGTKLGQPNAGNRRGGIAQSLMGYFIADASTTMDGAVIHFVDSPSSTSALTYTVSFSAKETSKLIYLNRTVDDTDNSSRERGVTTITLTEIAG